MSEKRIAVIGGGAAGFFAAVTAAEANPSAQVVIYERGRQFLQKVKISGGGRCNVTHACFDPKKLALHYPRGSRELLGAFFHWQPKDTIRWFEDRGVALKTEPDGRMFPVTDSSQTIIDALMRAARRAGVSLRSGTGIEAFHPLPNGGFRLDLKGGEQERADVVLVAIGSLKGAKLSSSIEQVGHSITSLAPSLFAFNVTDARLQDLAGVSLQEAEVNLIRSRRIQAGPLLITHRGLSGPAVLKLSAWEARGLQEADYHFPVSINWLGKQAGSSIQAQFHSWRQQAGKVMVKNRPFDGIPKRLWERLVEAAGIMPERTWAQLSKAEAEKLEEEIVNCSLTVEGKTTHKEEFVTCGGVSLDEVNFRKMESKIVPGLFFAGEALDFDGITGGFNFQAAWTTGRLAGLSMAAG